MCRSKEHTAVLLAAYCHLHLTLVSIASGGSLSIEITHQIILCKREVGFAFEKGAYRGKSCRVESL